MTPKEKAHEIEIYVKSMGFQVDTYRGRKITELVIRYIIAEYKEIEKVHGVNAADPVRFWNEVKEEALKLF